MTKRYPELDPYDYPFPAELVALAPVVPRDSARLFVYNTANNVVTHAHVSDLPNFIAGCLLVTNDTTVLPARLHARYADGSLMELLILVDQGSTQAGNVRALVNRGVAIGDIMTVADVTFTVLENHEKSMLLSVSGGEAAVRALLEQHGETPLPPYIHSDAAEETKRQLYQTMFARSAPSVAAPTASLHFTPDLMRRLSECGVDMATVTLQVGLGTFAPIYPENFTEKKLHRERYLVPEATAKAVEAAYQSGRPVCAVGTTVVRTLESAKDTLVKGEACERDTDIFIFPPHSFTFPDMLMTNFHVPKSSLLCLVQAYLEHKKASRHIIDLYREAIDERYRFFSFGDAMLIL